MAEAGRLDARRRDGRGATIEAVTVGRLALALPEPCLVVLVGAAGSGKSTLAAHLFAADAVLSSDAYRRLVSGDESDQGATREAFRRLHRDLHVRLAERRTTVVDATNVTAYARRSTVRIAATHGVGAVAIVLDLDPVLIHARNATRSGRIVPSGAVDQQLRDLARTLRRDELASEGFVAIHHLRSPAEVQWLEDGLSRSGGGPSRT